MNTRLSRIVVVVVVAVAGSISSEAFAQRTWCYRGRVQVRQTTITVQKQETPPPVQPACDSQRPEIPSGATVDFYAPFLRKEAGVVLLEIGGTSIECKLVEWQPDYVTVDLPRLGLVEPKNAEVSIVLPDGRIAKTFKVRIVRQPGVVVHEDSIPQPNVPVPAMAAPASYVVPVQGGFTLYGN